MKFFRNLVYIVLILAMAFLIFSYLRKESSSKSVPVITPTETPPGNTQNINPPTFFWSFKDSDKKDLDGFPKTEVYLEAKYENGQTKKELVDTAQGSCNELPGNKEVRLVNTEVVQCYAAGFGYRYKITKGDNSYNINRQEFEEASPDYDTTPSEFKSIFQFPFTLNESDVQPGVALVDGRQCYSYNHTGTAEAPYTVNEILDITIDGDKVTGTKTGNQSGPDMTNGYTGAITGTLDDNRIDVVFAYTVEGSKNKEQEIYIASKTGLEKLRYPLLEGKGVLIPDTSKDFTEIDYVRVPCEASN